MTYFTYSCVNVSIARARVMSCDKTTYLAQCNATGPDILTDREFPHLQTILIDQFLINVEKQKVVNKCNNSGRGRSQNVQPTPSAGKYVMQPMSEKRGKPELRFVMLIG